MRRVTDEWRHSWSKDLKTAYCEKQIDEACRISKASAQARDWDEVESALTVMRHWLEVLRDLYLYY